MGSRALVLNFEHWDFDIVSDFGFRYSDFHFAWIILWSVKIGAHASLQRWKV